MGLYYCLRIDWCVLIGCDWFDQEFSIITVDNHMALRENGLAPILVQSMNKAYQNSNTRHVQGAPAGYMVSKFLYILVYVKR